MAYYNGKRVFGVMLGESVVKRSTGKDSVVNVTTDDDVSRENTAAGNYATALGSRNNVSGSESAALGGLIEVSGEDALGFGYRTNIQANQSLAGGYRVTNKASESVAIGDQVTIDGTITLDENGSPTSNSRYNALFGRLSSMGTNTKNCFMAGESISQGNSAKWNAIFGYGHTIGHHNECVTVFDYQNTTENYITDSLISGYSNKVRNKNGSSSNKKYDVYIFGHDNTNRDASENDHSNVYIFGKGLRPVEDDQTIVGAYNAGTAHCWFEVGCGGSSSDRRSAFAVCQQGSNYWLEMNGRQVIPPAPTTDGSYSLKVTIASGTPSYSWVAD